MISSKHNHIYEMLTKVQSLPEKDFVKQVKLACRKMGNKTDDYATALYFSSHPALAHAIIKECGAHTPLAKVLCATRSADLSHVEKAFFHLPPLKNKAKTLAAGFGHASFEEMRSRLAISQAPGVIYTLLVSNSNLIPKEFYQKLASNTITDTKLRVCSTVAHSGVSSKKVSTSKKLTTRCMDFWASLELKDCISSLQAIFGPAGLYKNLVSLKSRNTDCTLAKIEPESMSFLIYKAAVHYLKTTDWLHIMGPAGKEYSKTIKDHEEFLSFMSANEPKLLVQSLQKFYLLEDYLKYKNNNNTKDAVAFIDKLYQVTKEYNILKDCAVIEKTTAATAQKKFKI